MNLKLGTLKCAVFEQWVALVVNFQMLLMLLDQCFTLLTSPSKEKFTTEEEKNDFDRALVQKRLQIWVLRAELLKRMGSFGRMDPFVVVEHVKSDGHVWEFAHTRTDWGGHMKPNFNHLCRSIEVDSDDVIRFRLLEKSFGDLGNTHFLWRSLCHCEELTAEQRSRHSGRHGTL